MTPIPPTPDCEPACHLHPLYGALHTTTCTAEETPVADDLCTYDCDVAEKHARRAVEGCVWTGVPDSVMVGNLAVRITDPRLYRLGPLRLPESFVDLDVKPLTMRDIPTFTVDRRILEDEPPMPGLQALIADRVADAVTRAETCGHCGSPTMTDDGPGTERFCAIDGWPRPGYSNAAVPLVGLFGSGAMRGVPSPGAAGAHGGGESGRTPGSNPAPATTPAPRSFIADPDTDGCPHAPAPGLLCDGCSAARRAEPILGATVTPPERAEWPYRDGDLIDIGGVTVTIDSRIPPGTVFVGSFGLGEPSEPQCGEPGYTHCPACQAPASMPHEPGCLKRPVSEAEREERRKTPHEHVDYLPLPVTPEPRDRCDWCGLVRAAYVHTARRPDVAGTATRALRDDEPLPPPIVLCDEPGADAECCRERRAQQAGAARAVGLDVEQQAVRGGVQFDIVAAPAASEATHAVRVDCDACGTTLVLDPSDDSVRPLSREVDIADLPTSTFVRDIDRPTIVSWSCPVCRTQGAVRYDLAPPQPPQDIARALSFAEQNLIAGILGPTAAARLFAERAAAEPSPVPRSGSRDMTLDKVSPGLIDALRTLGETYGPSGVARVAALVRDLRCTVEHAPGDLCPDAPGGVALGNCTVTGAAHLTDCACRPEPRRSV